MTFPDVPFAYRLDMMEPWVPAELVVRVKARNAEATLEDLETSLGLFADLAGQGLTGLPPHGSPHLRADVTAMERPEPGSLMCRMLLHGVDGVAVRMLFSMLCQCHFEDEPMAEVCVTCSPALEIGVGAERVRALPWPSRQAELPFTLTMEEDAANRQELVLRVTLGRKPTEKEREMLVIAVENWDGFVILGGLLDTFAEQENPPFWPGSTHFLSPLILEHPVHSYTAGTVPLDAFIHLMVHLHGMGVPIVDVEIE